MSSTWGNNIKYSIFGESHGEGIGIVIDNLPPGLEVDFAEIRKDMARRKPGSSKLSTPRNEEDEFDILSGMFMGRTTGAPLCVFIKNSNQHSEDYDKLKDLVRPGHADFTAFIKYKGFNDYRGGGHFSGRLTAALVFAGAVAKQILILKDINIISHIYKIGSDCDKSFTNLDMLNRDLSFLRTKKLPVIDPEIEASMEKKIIDVKEQGDSIGGVVEAAILNLPAGLGSPFFDSLESTISHLVFAIPGVKGIEFGDGFALAGMKGSESNDSFFIENNKIQTRTNHNGGILGGISNGMPIILRAAFKPTSSIALEQDTVNINLRENAKIMVEGRHDPCIVPRGLVAVEAAAALAILEHLQINC